MIHDGKDLKSTQLQKLDYNYIKTRFIYNPDLYNQRKTISGTGNHMTIQFITNDYSVQRGFRTYFNRIPIDSNCSKWLNTTSLFLASPEYPKTDCTWIITASIGSTMSINFQKFEVKIS